jgi:hypothetical protein
VTSSATLASMSTSSSRSSPELLDEVIETTTLLRRYDEPLDSVGVIVEFGNSCGLLESQEVVPFDGCFSEFGADDGEGCVDCAALDLGPLGDLSGRHTESAELLDHAELLAASKCRAVSIFSVLRQDAFDLSGIVGCVIADDLDGHRGESRFDCCKRATVAETYSHVTCGGAYGGYRYKHTEVFDAGDEVLVEAWVGADVHVDEQTAWVEFGSDGGRVGGGLVDGHVAVAPWSFHAGAPARREDPHGEPRAARASRGSAVEQRVSVRACAHECASARFA